MTGARRKIPGEWQRTHVLTVLAAGIRTLWNSLIPLIAILLGAQAMDGEFAFLLPLFAAIILFNLFAAWLGWVRLRYRVGTSDIKLEKGLISRSARSVPYERIQDVSLEQKPIPRLLGLVEVKFETGAGGKDELKLAYVTQEEGERLREVVRDQRDGEAVQEAVADAPVAAEEAQLLFAMSPARLLLFGMFEFSLVAIAVIAGLAQQFDFLLPFEIWDTDGWEERLAGPWSWLAGLGWASRLVGALLVLVVLLVMGMATGIVRTVLRDWDFRLERTSKGFRRRRGLLTRTDVVMPVHRVQAGVVSTGLLRRIWGWHGLSFVSLAQDAGSANHVVAPFAQTGEIEPIVHAADFAMPGQETAWHRPSPYYRFDRALLTALAPGLSGLALLAFAPSIWAGIAMLALAGFLALRQHFLWRYERHAVDPRQILSRRGWLAPKLVIANRVKLHSVEIAQGPIARRRGYADLRFGLAGGRFSFDGLRLEDAEQMRAAVLGSIAAVDFSRLMR